MVILIASSSILLSGGEIRCGRPYTIILNGHMHHHTHGYTIRWDEHMELEKVHKHGGIDGRWKITRWTIRMSLPMLSAISLEKTFNFNIPGSGGMHGRIHLSIHGSESVQRLVDSHLYLDIKNHRIGFKKQNLWIGEIYDDLVSLQFFQPEQLRRRGYHFQQKNETFPSTLLTGFITGSRSRRTQNNIEIVFPDSGNDYRVVFSSYRPAVAAITAKIKSSAPLPDGKFTWEIDSTGSIETEIIGNGGKQVVFHFKAFPRNNNRFGEHEITVRYHSIDGYCQGTASARIKLVNPALRI